MAEEFGETVVVTVAVGLLVITIPSVVVVGEEMVLVVDTTEDKSMLRLIHVSKHKQCVEATRFDNLSVS